MSAAWLLMIGLNAGLVAVAAERTRRRLAEEWRRGRVDAGTHPSQQTGVTSHPPDLGRTAPVADAVSVAGPEAPAASMSHPVGEPDDAPLPLATPTTARPRGGEAVRIGLAHCGRWDPERVRQIAAFPGVELVALAPEPGWFDAAATHVPSLDTHPDPVGAGAGLDSVIVGGEGPDADSTTYHSLVTGIGVYVDGPLASDAEIGRRLISAVDRSAGLLMVRDHVGGCASERRALELIGQAGFGRVHHVDIDHTGMVREAHLRTPAPLLGGLAARRVAFVNNLFRGLPRSVTAWATSAPDDEGPEQVEIHLEYQPFGDPDDRSPQTATIRLGRGQPVARERVAVMGSGHTVVIEEAAAGNVTLHSVDPSPDAESSTTTYRVFDQDPFTTRVSAFIDALRGAPAQGSGLGALEVLRILDGATQSIATGRRIDFSLTTPAAPQVSPGIDSVGGVSPGIDHGPFLAGSGDGLGGSAQPHRDPGA